MDRHTARCSCGQLTATCEGEPVFVSMCHCQQCQMRTGSVFAVNAAFAADKVQVQGEERSYTRLGDSGRKVTFHFCTQCGNSVFWEGEMRPDMRVLGVGSFIDPSFTAPVRAVWAESRHPWVKEPTDIPVFPKGAGHAHKAATT